MNSYIIAEIGSNFNQSKKLAFKMIKAAKKIGANAVKFQLFNSKKMYPNDDKMYRLNGQCFDCQIKFEHQLRLEGKFEEWEEKRVLNNKLAWLKDQIVSIEEWKDDSQKPVEHFDQVGVKDVELHKETWSNNTEQVEMMAKESLEELNKMKSEVEEKLNSLEV